MTRRGFTLVEMSIALAVVGLLLAATLLPMRALEETRKRGEEMTELELSSDAIVGYALRNRTRERMIIYAGAGRTQVAANPITIPEGRPYLPCPDVDGDGFEDRIPDGANGFVQGVESNDAAVLTLHISVERGRPTWSRTSPTHNYGGCRASRGTLPWRTLGIPPADNWGNRRTYFVDPVYASALIGFDAGVVANIYDARAPRSLSGPPPLRNSLAFDVGLGGALAMDRQCPAVICSGGRGGCVSHLGTGCAINLSANPVWKAGLVATATITDASPEVFPAGGVLEGLPFVIVSHGPNGRGAVNHWTTLNNPQNIAGVVGPVCNRARMSTTTGGNFDVVDSPLDNHEAINANRFAPGNQAGERRCPPLRGVLVAGDPMGVELNPSVFVWEPSGGNRADRIFDDILIWMTRRDLLSALQLNIPRLPPLLIVDATPSP